MEEEYITCPACNMKMHKIFIANFNSHIDVCNICGGIFLDYSEFEHIEDNNTPAEELEDFFNRMGLYQNVQVRKTIYCPKCNEKMVEVSKRHTELYECSSCLGVFIDKEKIDKYRKEYIKGEQLYNYIVKSTKQETLIEFLLRTL